MTAPQQAEPNVLGIGPSAWLNNSLIHQSRELRRMARRCRKTAYSGEMAQAATMLADVYERAAECFERDIRRKGSA